MIATAPTRMMDTRSGARPEAGSTRSVTVTGRAGIPTSGVSAVVMNLTVVSPAKSGWAAVFPAGATRPVVSSINYVTGETVANQAVANIGKNGQISVYTASAAHLLVDVMGYFPVGGGYTAVTPSRVVDSRSTGVARAAGSTTTIALGGKAGVPPSGATAAIVNVTVVSPAGDGYAQVYPVGVPRPTASSVNFAAKRTAAGLAIAALDAQGRFNIYTSSSAHLIVDVAGWIGSGSTYTPVTPVRALDTRYGVGATRVRVPATGGVTIRLAGTNGLPKTGIEAVQATVTAVRPSSAGYLAAVPAAGPSGETPVVSSVNFAAGMTAANAVTLKLGWNGAVTVSSSAETDLILDITGYWVTPDAAATQVAVGVNQACAVLSTGTMRCWGNNWSGQLGAGIPGTSKGFSAVPMDVVGLSDVKSAAAGSTHMCALTRQGVVWCWGDNWNQQLGRPSGAEPAPVRVALAGSATSIEAGYEHTCAVLASGQVQCWGRNDLGQLGNGTTDQTYYPTFVTGVTSARLVSAGFDHSCALLIDGTARCWGRANNNMLGDGDGTVDGVVVRTEPVTVKGVSAATGIVTGSDMSCVTGTSNGHSCWGRGSGVATGLAQIPGLQRPQMMSLSYWHGCIVTTGSAAQCWGDNSSGQAGAPSGSLTGPRVVSGLGSDVVEVSAGGNSSCAVRTTGGVVCWGSRQGVGLLGDGQDSGATSTPVKVLGFG
ncbi:RCC1 domain-containing protein [Branchiibius hedensis]|nr:hypothetical protein [Branchiibius hedensis]